VLDALPQVCLAIVGDGPLRPALEAQFAETQRDASRTVFTGYLRGDDLAAAYAAADLFTFPSANETFGNVVLEAMASGLPVIAPRAGGPVDLITQGVNGFLCAPEDQNEWLAFIRLCVEDPALLQLMGQHARHFAESRSWEMVFSGLLCDYATLLKPKSPLAAKMHPRQLPPPIVSPDLRSHL
jgi:glycosyltransferase involved in cell wall biosynthesis